MVWTDYGIKEEETGCTWYETAVSDDNKLVSVCCLRLALLHCVIADIILRRGPNKLQRQCLTSSDVFKDLRFKDKEKNLRLEDKDLKSEDKDKDL